MASHTVFLLFSLIPSVFYTLCSWNAYNLHAGKWKGPSKMSFSIKLYFINTYMLVIYKAISDMYVTKIVKVMFLLG
jgi:hypothetical protein